VGGADEYVMYLRHLFAYQFSKKYLQKDFEVLDLGCGEGYGTDLLSQSVNSIIGIDVDPEVVKYAQEKYGSQNCRFEVYDGAMIRYQEKKFDVITSFQVIEHVKDDHLFIEEIHRLLKPGGWFIMTTPNKTMRMRPLQKPFNRFHIREYYPHELRNLLEKKFSRVDIFGVSGNEQIMLMETKRIDQVQKNLNNPIKNWIPEKVRSSVKGTLKSIKSKFKSSSGGGSFVKQFHVEDFFVIKNDVYRGLDLLGVCEK